MKRALAICAALTLAACSSSSPLSLQPSGSEFVGQWMRQQTTPYQPGYSHPETITQYIDISRDGSTFLLNLHTDNMRGISGTFTATYQDGVLHSSVPMLGDIAYLKSADAIVALGSQFSHVPSLQSGPAAGGTITDTTSAPPQDTTTVSAPTDFNATVGLANESGD